MAVTYEKVGEEIRRTSTEEVIEVVNAVERRADLVAKKTHHQAQIDKIDAEIAAIDALPA